MKDMFEAKSFEDLKASGATVRKKERVVVDIFIDIAGYTFELDDLWETLCEIEHNRDIVITNDAMVEFFDKFAIATKGSMRNCISAEPRANFTAFKTWIEEKYAANYRA